MKLRGISQKGKNRIREHGDSWEILHVRCDVLFDSRPGPWWFIAPINEDPNASRHSNLDASRWMHSKHDKHLEIVDN